MRGLKAGFLALALASGLAGCGGGGSAALSAVDTDPKAVEALVAKLETEAFKGKATAATDFAAVRDALPKEMTLGWDNLTFDAATASTVLTNVKLGLADVPGVSININELRLYDFDAELAKARLMGQRLTESAPLAARIDAKGISLVGMAAMLNQTMGFAPVVAEPPVAVTPEAPVPPEGATPEDWPAATEPEFEFDDAMFATSFDKYDFSYGRVILNDVVLRPYAAPTTPPTGGMADMYGPSSVFMQQIISVTGAFGIDAFAAYDMKADLSMTQMGQKISATFSAETTGTRGMRGGDMDAAFIRGMALAFDADGSSFTGAPPMNFSYAVDLMGIEDMRFDKLYKHIAAGTLPPRTETDVLSYGLFTMQNQVVKVGGKDIMKVGESSLDARKFHWLIPTELKASASNAVIDFAAITQMSGEMAAQMQAQQAQQWADPDADPDMAYTPPPLPDFAAIAAAMEKNGLARPNTNFNFGWNWNPTSGDAKIDLGFGGENLMQMGLKYEGGFPDFKSASDLFPEDGGMVDSTAFAQLFDKRSTMKLINVNVADNGGLAKMFNFAADMGPIMAAGDPSGFNPLEGQTGESLRQMAGGMLTMLGATPDLAPFITPMANFIMQGGKLNMTFQPSQPMTFSAFAEKMSGSMQAPGAALKEIGLKVEHSK
jgi:hypothetical protein